MSHFSSVQFPVASPNPVRLRRMLRVVTVALLMVFSFSLMPRSTEATQFQTPEAVAQYHWNAMRQMWAPVVQQSGRTWAEPGFAWYNYSYDSMSIQTACGKLTAKVRVYSGLNQGGNSFYCSTDRRIYLDYAFHQYLIRVWGDYASGFVLTHEYAHHIQALLGWNRYVGSAMELQADCYAGIYSRYAASLGMADSSDLYEGYRLAWYFAGGHMYTDSGSHGSGEQRAWWFNQGYTTYSVAECNRTYQYSPYKIVS